LSVLRRNLGSYKQHGKQHYKNFHILILGLQN
jgi:hypothetical protein